MWFEKAVTLTASSVMVIVYFIVIVSSGFVLFLTSNLLPQLFTNDGDDIQFCTNRTSLVESVERPVPLS